MSLRSIAPVLAGLAAFAALAGCNGYRPEANDQGLPAVAAAGSRTLQPRTLKQVPFELSWDLQLPGAVSGSWVLPQMPELLFVQVKGGGNEIYCIEMLSGATRWVSVPLAKPITGEPSAVRTIRRDKERPSERQRDDRLYLISDDTLICFDVGSGQVSWRYELGFAPSSGPLAVGEPGSPHVFLGDWNNRLQVIALNADKGWPYVAWQMPLEAVVSSAPTERENLVYLGDSVGQLRCFKLDREQVWGYGTGAAIPGSALLRDRVLYAGNANNTFLALNRLTGERLGQLNLNGPVLRAPFALAGEPNRVYAWGDNGDQVLAGLYQIDAQPDNVAFAEQQRHPIEVVRLGVRWHVPGAHDLIAATPEHLLVVPRVPAGQVPTVVWAVNRASGAIDWTWDLDADRSSGQVDAYGRPLPPPPLTHLSRYIDVGEGLRTVVMADASGRVIAYRMFGFSPKDREALAAYKVEAAQRAAAEKAKADKAEKAKADKAEKDKPAGDANK